MQKYQKPSVSTDTLLLRQNQNSIEALFILRKNEPFKKQWAIPGGFVNINESIHNAAIRELKEETSISTNNIYIEQIYSFGNTNRDPRGRTITILYSAIIPKNKSNTKANTDASKTKWININEIPKLAFDHNKLATFTINRLKKLCLYTPILFQTIQNFYPNKLSSLYNSILNTKINEKILITKLLNNKVIIPAENINKYNFNINNIHFYNKNIFTTIPQK